MYLQLKTCKTIIKEAGLLTGVYCCLDHLLTLHQDQISSLITTLEPIQGEAIMRLKFSYSVKVKLQAE